MKILINGQTHELTCKTLAELLRKLEHEANAVATAVNGTFVAVCERDSFTLSNDDEVDIIAPMAGG